MNNWQKYNFFAISQRILSSSRFAWDTIHYPIDCYSTDAGSTGLNLQAASTIINLDLPWNPAVLEQRIARIYRIGQQRNIQVINLVAAHTIEESMIGKLKFKTSLFEGVLDGVDDAVFASDDKFAKIMDLVGEYVEPSAEEPRPDDSGTTVETGDVEPNKWVLFQKVYLAPV